MCLKARAFEAHMLRAYVHVIARNTFCFATIYLSRYMFILNWDFDILPITFDENFMLCFLAESM